MAINLLPIEEKNALKTDKIAKRLAIILSFALAALICFFGLLLALRWSLQGEIASAQKQITEKEQSLTEADFDESLEEIEVEVNPRALVIGGGIAGMTCALSLANRGFEVKLIEKEDRLGGTLNNLYMLYPTHEEA